MEKKITLADLIDILPEDEEKLDEILAEMVAKFQSEDRKKEMIQ